jgi:hypothetical protein
MLSTLETRLRGVEHLFSDKNASIMQWSVLRSGTIERENRRVFCQTSW